MLLLHVSGFARECQLQPLPHMAVVSPAGELQAGFDYCRVNQIAVQKLTSD
jgi:hypothetical protein